MGLCWGRCCPKSKTRRYGLTRSWFMAGGSVVETSSEVGRTAFSLASILRMGRKKADDEVELEPRSNPTKGGNSMTTSLSTSFISRLWNAHGNPSFGGRTNRMGGQRIRSGMTSWRGGTRSHGGSASSLGVGDVSPQTASIDLEWEHEAEVQGYMKLNRGEDEENSVTQTLDSASFVPRSSCSTPNSLEWDFRESTLSFQQRAASSDLCENGNAGTHPGRAAVAAAAASAMAASGASGSRASNHSSRERSLDFDFGDGLDPIMDYYSSEMPEAVTNDDTWQEEMDLETEQLIQEIERLAARALNDTGDFDDDLHRASPR
ncbi:uncharacterized protein LOC143019753 isoform X7 [Oratosquilla oratoria]|uniref:uncharacterized protein LOC143019753 isoform X5 n=1 Tax=Oratosquilla oratoria TaxID=337810 RepID=UPI003F762434